MRVRVDERPPTRHEIDELVQYGVAPKADSRLIKRLRRSCYLSKENQPLTPRERLTEQYKQDGLVLFLGAGVSCASGIPNWGCLVKRVLEDVGISDYDNIQRTFPSLITQFEVAAQNSKSPLEFTRTLCRCLYRDLKFRELLKDIPKDEHREATWGRAKWSLVLTELQQNETLKEVAELLILDEEKKLRKNPQVHAVLTTNGDNLLEVYCRARVVGQGRIVTTVDRASVGDHPDSIPIYHLHGHLDAREENIVRTDPPCTNVPEKDLQPIDGDLLPELVFRESEYYKTIANPMNFVNHTPQSYLQRLNVLFVGTSLDDLNVRRWLYSSFQERCEQRARYLAEYYCRYYQDARYEAELESVRHFWIRTRTECCQPLRTGLIDLNVRMLGVQVIWCDDYPAVQQCIRELKEKGKVADFGRKLAAGRLELEHT